LESTIRISKNQVTLNLHANLFHRKAARGLLTLDEKDPRRIFEGFYFNYYVTLF